MMACLAAAETQGGTWWIHRMRSIRGRRLPCEPGREKRRTAPSLRERSPGSTSTRAPGLTAAVASLRRGLNTSKEAAHPCASE
jgi:hypothetical protein